MRLAILILILLCRAAPAATAGSVTDPKKGTLLAVMDIQNNTGEFSSFVDGMPDMLITELLETGDVKLVERSKVQTAMKALKLETSGLTQAHNLELGKWLGVDGILFGAFNRVGDRYRLDVRAIDVQTGEINASASAMCGRQNVLDIVPEIGKQLRVKLGAAAAGRSGGDSGLSARAAPPNPARPAVDSCTLEVRYKMKVGLWSESAIPHQRVKAYLDGRPLGISGVVDDLNRYFTVFHGNVPAGSHVLSLIHGTVDQRGRWIRELGNQPEPYRFTVRKDDRPTIQYQMHAHEDGFNFKSFEMNYHTPNDGE